jgi:hypothetical protein
MRSVRLFPTRKVYNGRTVLSEQVDIAVELGVVPPPLPEIMNLRQLVEAAPAPLPQIIEGVLHQGVQDDPPVAPARVISRVPGRPGRERRQRGEVVGSAVRHGADGIINFELHVWAIAQRLSTTFGLRR